MTGLFWVWLFGTVILGIVAVACTLECWEDYNPYYHRRDDAIAVLFSLGVFFTCWAWPIWLIVGLVVGGTWACQSLAELWKVARNG